VKRLLVGFAAAAFCAVALGAATASAKSAWTLTLTVDPSTFAVNDGTDVSGQLLNPAGKGMAGGDVTIYWFDGHGCSGDPLVSFPETTGDDGFYEHAFTVSPAGDYSVASQAVAGEKYVDSPCVDVTVTSATPEPSPAPATQQRGEIGMFLCYSKWQVVPGVWPFGKAEQLMKAGGYWLPYAVPGNVAFGTNMGDYHLVCNVASTQSVSGSFLGAGVNVYSPDIAKAMIGDTFGPFYPVVGG